MKLKILPSILKNGLKICNIMRNFLTFLFVCCSYIAYSQSYPDDESETENNKLSTFEEEAKPSLDSELSIYFEKHLSKELIAKSGLTSKRKRLMLTFSFDDKDKLIASTNTKNKSLNDEIIKAFKNYPKEKLVLEYFSPFTFYNLQILEFENGENSIKCNSVLISNSYPIFMECKNSKNSQEVKDCNQSLLANYIAKNFNTNIAKKTGISEAKIYAMFKIAPSGEIEDVKVKAPNPSLELETIKIINTFPFTLYKPGHHHGKPSLIKYSLPIRLNVK